MIWDGDEPELVHSDILLMIILCYEMKTFYITSYYPRTTKIQMSSEKIRARLVTSPKWILSSSNLNLKLYLRFVNEFIKVAVLKSTKD